MKKLILLTLFFCSLQIIYAQPGNLDPSFGNKGIVTSDLGSPYNYGNYGNQVLLQPDGSMYLLIRVNGTSLLTKKHPDGSTDMTYGNNGYSASVSIYGPEVEAQGFESYGAHAAQQADGKIVVVGYAVNPDGYTDQSDFAIARFNTDGSLDNTFDEDGVKIFDFGNDDIATSVAIQNDGKIVVVGFSKYYDGDYASIAILRYNSDGSLDSTFDGDGIIFTNIPSSNVEEYADAVVIQPDGKIVVLGRITIGLKFSNEIIRYNNDGSLDNSFSGDGKEITPFYATKAISIQNDGKIILSGNMSQGSGTTNDFVVARYNSNGTPDNSFDGDGTQKTDFDGGDDVCTSMAIQSDGKIVLAGFTNGTNNNFAIARYNSDGSPDNSFDGDGKQLTDFGSIDYANSIAIQSDGKLLVFGYTVSGLNTNFALARYNANGNSDNSFDGDGKLIDHITQGNTYYTSTAIQNDGKIIAAGYTWNGSNYDFAIVRYNTDGTPDDSFDSDGKQITDFSFTDDRVNAIAIQSDGKILVAGSSGGIFALARYNADGNLDNSFNGDGKQTTDLGYYATSIAVQSDGKILAGGSGPYYGEAILARYNANGTLDVSFDGDGKIITPSNCRDIAIQNDGKILITGERRVARYNSDGSADLTFGDQGVQQFFPGDDEDGESRYFFKSIAIQNDGKIILGGYYERDYRITQSVFALARVNADGTPDYSFGNNGITRTTVPAGLDYATSVTLQNDNKIILAGYSYNGSSNDFTILRYTTDGTLDNTFSDDGIQITHVSGADDRIAGIAIADNKLYAAGYGQFPGYFGVVARYLLDNESQTPPTVSITTPAHDTTYIEPARIKINAAASDEDGTITKVDFYNGATLIHTETVAPYDCIIDSAVVGHYAITAKATDNDGNVATSAVVNITVIANIPPTISIKTPLEGESFPAPANVVLSALANDVDGRIIKVEFYNGNNLIFSEAEAPFKRKWFHLRVGNYSITAKAYDNNGAVTTSAPVNFSVVTDIAPMVSITSPANGAQYTAPATIILSANASDIDGTVRSVDFYNGNTLLFTEKYLPYSNTWANVPAGDYSITAVATDNNGKTTTSAPVAISVAAAGRPIASGGKLNFSNRLLSLNINPNPVAKTLNISIEGLQTNSKSAISLLSVSGAVIKTIQSNTLNKNTRLDVSSLSAGVYFIKVINGDKVLYKQFVKL